MSIQATIQSGLTEAQAKMLAGIEAKGAVGLCAVGLDRRTLNSLIRRRLVEKRADYYCGVWADCRAYAIIAH